MDKKGQPNWATRVRQIDMYAKNCSDCPLKNVWTKAKGNREIEVNHTLNGYKLVWNL